MKRVLFAAGAVWLAAVTGVGQTPAPSGPPPQRASSPGPAGEVLGTYNRLKPNVIKAAEEMPDAEYQFKPTPEIRTYARIVNHVTEAQQHTCSALNGTTFEAKTVPSDTADKATIVAGLRASFDVCDKAYGALTDASIAELVDAGRSKRSRIGMAWGNVSHDNEQYAELSTYLRLKGLVPPTAEK